MPRSMLTTADSGTLNSSGSFVTNLSRTWVYSAMALVAERRRE